METGCHYTDKEKMWISTDERWLINRILRFRANHPDDVHVIKFPEENDGCLYCTVPTNWLKITPPTKRNLSDEQRVAAGQRLKNARQNKI